MSIRSQVNKLEEQNPNFGVYSKQSLEAKNEAEKIPYLINGDYYILRNGAFRPVVNAGTLAELLGRDMSKATSNAKTLSVEEAQKIAPVGGAEATIQVIKDIGQLKSGETFTDPNSPFNYQVGESGNLKQIGEARYNPTTKYAQEQAKGAEANRIADEAKYGINVSQGTGGATTGGKISGEKFTWDTTNFSDYPAELKNSEIWKNATAYDKLMLYTTYKTKSVQDPQIQSQMLEALNGAMTSLDPYYKMKTRLATDEIERSIGKLTGDYQSNLKSYDDKIKQIKEDLIFNKDQLSFDQQQEMANQLRDYEGKKFNLDQQMAESGLAFSSPRTTAENTLNADTQGMSQSTQRKYAQTFREQDLNAQRQTALLQQNIADLERKKSEGITDISRQGETLLGSANMTGGNLLGGIQGTLEMDKQAKALQYGNTIADYFKPNL